VKLKFSR